MNADLKDLELVEKSGFTPDVKFVAQMAVVSLHLLKSLSSKLCIPIEQITAEQIIQEFSQADAQIREHTQKFAAFFAGSRP